MNREELIKRIKKHYWFIEDETNIELMNVLQDDGLVSDCAVTIDDVPDIDLVNAYEKINQGEGSVGME